MAIAQKLEKILGVKFEQQPSILAVRQFHSNNTFCVNEKGEITGLAACENEFTEIVLPAEDFQFLEYLNLSDNKSLQSIKFEGEFPHLVHFDVSDSKLKSIEFIEGFTELMDVYLQGNQLELVTFQGQFPKLRLLDISSNEQLSSIPDNLVRFEKLQYVYVRKSPILLGEENLKDETGNVWGKIRAYLAEYAKGTKFNYRAKMIVVGNGRVGKTSMVKRIQGKPFDPKEKFTHGITLGEITKEHLEKIESKDFSMKAWDFGGQEIFYATHQFFMTDSALYVLAWTNPNNIAEYKKRMSEEDEEIEFGEKWRDEHNWLENIRAYTTTAPIIMVQTHCEMTKNRVVPNSKFSGLPYNVEFCNFSAPGDIGLKELKLLISDRLKDLPYFGKEYPETYDKVIEALQSVRANYPHITKVQFFEICKSAKVDKENVDALLAYLNETGVCVYYPDNKQLEDKIFIDPEWLTKCVYALLNKKLKEVDGEMDDQYIADRLDDLKKKKNIEIAKDDLIELLKNFKLIFETEERDEDSGQPVKIYIYPEYLPERLGRIEKKYYRTFKEQLQTAFYLRFTNYLPENVLINIISHYGPDMTDDLAWKNGICFTNKEQEKALIEFDPTTNIFTVMTGNGLQAEQLQQEICKQFNELGRNTEMELSIYPGQGFVEWSTLTHANTISLFNAAADQDNFMVMNTQKVAFRYCDFAPLALENWMRQRKEKETGIITMPPIYFSYAWKDDNNPEREILVEEIFQELKASNFDVKRDKENCLYGEYIDEFMKDIGKGKMVVVFLSEKYLLSQYCMSELFFIAQKNGWDKLDFKDKILPVVVEPVNFDSGFLRKFLKHWKAIEEDNRAIRKEFSQSIGAGLIAETDRMIEVSTKASDLYTWLKNLNRGSIQLYRENDFAAIKEKIQERLSAIPYFQEHRAVIEQFSKGLAELGQKLSGLTEKGK